MLLSTCKNVISGDVFVIQNWGIYAGMQDDEQTTLFDVNKNTIIMEIDRVKTNETGSGIVETNMRYFQIEYLCLSVFDLGCWVRPLMRVAGWIVFADS